MIQIPSEVIEYIIILHLDRRAVLIQKIWRGRRAKNYFSTCIHCAIKYLCV
jgi:hypothetical protein